VVVGVFNSSAYPSIISTISGYSIDQFWKKFTYDLKHTPCAGFKESDYCFYPDHVSDHFTKEQMLKDLQMKCYYGIRLRDPMRKLSGFFVGLAKTPLEFEEKDLEIFIIFSRRVALEIEIQKKTTAFNRRQKIQVMRKLT